MITNLTSTPWEDNGNGLIFGQVSGDNDEAPLVADVCANPDAYTEQEQVNARLIAAAPDLFEALKALTSTARTFRNVPKEEQEWTATDDEALDAAFAALEKAAADVSLPAIFGRCPNTLL